MSKRSGGNRAEQNPDKMIYRRPAPRENAEPGAGLEAAQAVEPPQPRETAAARAAKRAGMAAKRSQRRMSILAVGIGSVLVAALGAAVLLPMFSGQGDADSGSLSLPAVATSLLPGLEEEGEDYGDLEEALGGEEYVGTILAETKDAGLAYVEETLFLGDSNTVRMLGYKEVTGVTPQNGIGVVGMGITSFKSLRCVQFKGKTGSYTMPQAVELLQPRRVVINFGTNNVAGMGVDSFIDYYDKALDALQKAYPYADIIIGSIFPVDKYCENPAITNSRINRFNLALAQLATEKELKFLNWSEALIDAETGNCVFEYTLIDGYHLSKKGMDALFKYFRTHSYQPEDRRPKPLKAVPEIAASDPGQFRDPSKPQGPYSRASSSSSSAQQVEVVFTAYDQTGGKAGGGVINISGVAKAIQTLLAAPGETTLPAVAVPADGYQFVGWTCTVGSIANTGSQTLAGFTVPGHLQAGDSVTVTAIFKLAPSSSGSSSSVSSSSSSSAASSTSSAVSSSSSSSAAASSSQASSSSAAASTSSEEQGASSQSGDSGSSQGEAPASNADG